MKTLRTTLAIAALFTGSLAFASGNEVVSSNVTLKVTETASPSTYKLVYTNVQESDVRIVIYDSEGVRLHSEKLENKTAFAKPYDFSKLPDGNYFFDIEETGNYHRIKVEHK